MCFLMSELNTWAYIESVVNCKKHLFRQLTLTKLQLTAISSTHP